MTIANFVVLAGFHPSKRQPLLAIPHGLITEDGT